MPAPRAACAVRRGLPISPPTRPKPRRIFAGGKSMGRTTHMSAAALLCLMVPAHAQQTPQGFPPGPGQQIVTTSCNGCHPADRVRAGYTPEGWDSVIHMMQNFNTPVGAEDWPIVKAYLVK